MKIWFCFVGLFLSFYSAGSAWAQNGNLQVTPQMLRFQYATSDGQITLDCKPSLENAESQDWSVICGTGQDVRKYRVHLWVTMYERPVLPKQSYEVLYWVTDLNGSKAIDSGTTVWFNFKEPADLYTLSVNVSLDQDTAGLYLDLNPVP
jgi:hypothetical protein